MTLLAPRAPVLDTPRYTATLAVAMRLHEHQLDRTGSPYHHHLQDTARKLVAMFPDLVGAEEVDAALLHDTMTRPRTTASTLRALNVPYAVRSLVDALTWPGTMPYLAWIERLAASERWRVIRVKLADNLSNSADDRAFPGQAELRACRYDPAWRLLVAALPPSQRPACEAFRVAHVSPTP